jgi:hypothetical protein
MCKLGSTIKIWLHDNNVYKHIFKYLYFLLYALFSMLLMWLIIQKHLYLIMHAIHDTVCKFSIESKCLCLQYCVSQSLWNSYHDIQQLPVRDHHKARRMEWWCTDLWICEGKKQFYTLRNVSFWNFQKDLIKFSDMLFELHTNSSWNCIQVSISSTNYIEIST